MLPMYSINVCIINRKPVVTVGPTHLNNLKKYKTRDRIGQIFVEMKSIVRALPQGPVA